MELLFLALGLSPFVVRELVEQQLRLQWAALQIVDMGIAYFRDLDRLVLAEGSPQARSSGKAEVVVVASEAGVAIGRGPDATYGRSYSSGLTDPFR